MKRLTLMLSMASVALFACGGEEDLQINKIEQAISYCGGSTPCECGMTLNANRVMTSSDLLTGCTGTALLLEASLDCDGRSVAGNGVQNTVGLSIRNHNVTIKNCVVYNYTKAIESDGNSGASIGYDDLVIYNNILIAPQTAYYVTLLGIHGDAGTIPDVSYSLEIVNNQFYANLSTVVPYLEMMILSAVDTFAVEGNVFDSIRKHAEGLRISSYAENYSIYGNTFYHHVNCSTGMCPAPPMLSRGFTLVDGTFANHSSWAPGEPSSFAQNHFINEQLPPNNQEDKPQFLWNRTSSPVKTNYDLPGSRYSEGPRTSLNKVSKQDMEDHVYHWKDDSSYGKFVWRPRGD